jgi:hypothetical protein
MTGCRKALASLDEGVRGSMRFGDGDLGISTVTIARKNQEHRVLVKVFYIPSLKYNILSLGQLKEGGCTVKIDNGLITVLERCQARVTKRGVLIRVERRNCLYVLNSNLTLPVCLLMNMDDEG